MSREELGQLGWDGIDILLVSGDAYVDHPAFGAALLGRWLLAHGFRVGLVAQPRWSDKQQGLLDIQALGRPRLFAGVSAGALDSMLAHYTAFRKKRHDDAYTPGGQAGARPNRAGIVYTGLVRQAFPGLPVVLGGIEASMRRVSHYDFWSDSLRRSLLLDSKADLLVYGMGERALLGIASVCRDTASGLLCAPGQDRRSPAPSPKAAPFLSDAKLGQCQENSGISGKTLVAACRAIPGLAFALGSGEVEPWLAANAPDAVRLPPHEAIAAKPSLLMQATLLLEKQAHQGKHYAAQLSGTEAGAGAGEEPGERAGGRAVVLTPPAAPLCEKELDFLYALPYSRLPHPAYEAAIPAWEMIRTSITTHRGCAGGCSFCSLALHQGRRIASRSRSSVLAEAKRIAAGPYREQGREPGKAAPRWAGSISDVGGPSANMWQARCTLSEDKKGDQECARASCLHPAVCPRFALDQGQGVRLLRAIAALPGVRHLRIASGVRFDLALTDPEALYAYTSEFTGGQLKVAPEHSEAEVLRLMRKPDIALFERFLEAFKAHCRAVGKEQYTVPYLISAFPGCTLTHMSRLRAWLEKKNWSPRQIQCFIPTPGTVATAMYYAGISPDGAPIHVARTDHERLLQHHALPGGGAKSAPALKQRHAPKKGREK